MKEKAIVYTRVSTEEQKKTGTSLDNQIQKCEQYANDQGYKLLGSFRDDVSGMTPLGERPGLFEALELASREHAQVLVVLDVDRLARDELISMLIVQDFENVGARVEFATGGSTANVDDRLIIGIKRVIADNERRNILKRMTTGRYNRVADGKILGTHVPPLGYLYNENTKLLEKDPRAAHTIEYIFKTYAGGDVSLAKLEQLLEQGGHLTSGDLNPSISKKSARGKWNRTSIRKIIRNPAYYGQWVYGKVSTTPFEPVAVKIPAIVSKRLWEQANAQLDYNKKHRPSTEGYALKRRIKCGKCGNLFRRKIIKNKGRKYIYYVCNLNKCKARMHNGRRVEQAIAEWVLNLASSPAELKKELEIRKNNASKDNAPIQRNLKTIQTRLDVEIGALAKLSKLFLYEAMTEEQMQAESEGINSRIRLLEDQQSALVDQLQPISEFDLDILSEMFTDEYLDDIEELADYVQLYKEPRLAHENKLGDVYTKMGLAVVINDEQAELKCSFAAENENFPDVYHIVITFQGKTPTKP